MKFDVSSFDQLQTACRQLKKEFQPQTVFALHGELGSGKTTFVTHFLKQFSDNIQVTSPTYSIVNEYETDGMLFFHYDLYRLNHVMEVLNIGFEDYLAKGDYHFIEWPEIAEEILPDDTIHLYLKNSKFERTLTVQK